MTDPGSYKNNAQWNDEYLHDIVFERDLGDNITSIAVTPRGNYFAESRDGRIHFSPEVIDKVARTVDSMDRHSTVFDTAAIGITAYTLVEMARQSMGEDVTVGDVFTNSNLSDVLGGIDYQSLGQDLAIDAAIAVAQRAVGGPLSLAFSGYQLWQSYDGLSASLELYANHQGRDSVGDYFSGLFERDPEGHVFDDNTVETDPLVDDSLGFIGGAENHVSPLVLDIDGDGVAADLRHIYDDGTVFFDIDADGFAERVGWTGPDDGQLAYDRNGNGIIDDITELYGDDEMPAFTKLRLHDENGDGVLDAADADFTKLVVWRDINQDGTNQPGELRTFAERGIVSIDLNDTTDDRFVKENYISHVSTFRLTDGSVHEIADVHYLNDNANTWFLGAQSQVFGADEEIDEAALLLPQSRGYGSLPALHLSIGRDAELRTLVEELDGLGMAELDRAGELVETIMYHWAGVEDHDPAWRDTAAGTNIDSRKFDFLEDFGGVTWLQRDATPFVGVNASLGIKLAWQGVHAMITARLLAQGPMTEVVGEVGYDFINDTLFIEDDLEAMLERAEEVADRLHGRDVETFWSTLADVLVTLREPIGTSLEAIDEGLGERAGFDPHLGIKTLTEADGVLYSEEEGVPDRIVEGVRLGGESADAIVGGAGQQFMFGAAGDDRLEGHNGDDFLRGDDGGDRLFGGSGFDRLEGGDDDDVLDGDADRDILRGGDGDDILDGDGGDDNLSGGAGAGAGADRLVGGEGEDQLDYNESDGRVVVDLAAGTAREGNAEGDTFSSIEGVNGSQFDDALAGNAEGNLLNGERGNDRLWGRDGDDRLFGAWGDDELYGGAGNDVLSAYEGAERLDGGTGRDLVSYGHPFLEAGVVADLGLGRGSAGPADGDVYVAVEDLDGTRFGDVLIGDGGVNVLRGFEGADVLRGGAGDDVLVSLDGVDQLWGGEDADRHILATPRDEGPETASGDGPRDPVNGGDEAPVLSRDRIVAIHDFARNDDDVIDLSRQAMADVILRPLGSGTRIDLGDGRTLIVAGHTPDTFSSDDFRLPGSVDDIAVGRAVGFAGGNVSGSGADNVLFGQAGADEISGRAGDDVLVGESGDDRFVAGPGADLISGGSGTDHVDYGASFAAVRVDLEAGTVDGGIAEGDRLYSIEWLTGSLFDDDLRGDELRNELRGGAGDDAVFGRGGEDWLEGGAGGDYLDGGADADILFGGTGDDRLRGRDGDDNLIGGAGADRLEGGGGTDQVEYTGAREGVRVDFDDPSGNSGEAAGDTYISIEAVVGSTHADDLRGDDAANLIAGMAGADRIYGRHGDDELSGGAGDDHLDAGAGDDALWGEAGADRLFGQDGDDILVGGGGADRLDGGYGRDRASYSDAEAGVTVDFLDTERNGGDADGDSYRSIENLFGSEHDDDLRGDDDDDELAGFGGDDRLYGRGGDDRLSAGDGDDHVYGGGGDDVLGGDAGDDRLRGQAGADSLFGGEGADRFVVEEDSGLDVIADFVQGSDRIEFDIDGLGYSDLDFWVYNADDLRGVIVEYGGENEALLIRHDTMRSSDLSETDFVFN